MTLRLLNIEFNHVVYDEPRDVLYLSVNEPVEAADSVQTPEGHVIRYDNGGAIIGITLVNAKWLTEKNGSLDVTPPAEHIAREHLEAAFA